MSGTGLHGVPPAPRLDALEGGIRRRRRWPMAATALVVLLLAGGGLALARRGDREPQQVAFPPVPATPSAIPSPSPSPPPPTSPIDPTGVSAAVALSRTAFPEGAPRALLGREDLFPDLLASGVAQGEFDAPLLLTGTDSLPAETVAELERLGVDTVVILGGVDAIFPRVQESLTKAGYATERIAGASRVETAIAVAAQVLPDAETAILARANAGGDPTQGFVDALGAGAWAADAGFPVLLTESERLTPATRDYLAASAVTEVFIVGGVLAVSEAVARELEGLGIQVVRVSGATRSGTATAIAEARGFPAGSDLVLLLEGEGADAYAAGFPAASLADADDGFLMLTIGDQLPPETQDFLAASNGARALGCLPFVGEEVCGEAAELLGVAEEPCTPTDPSTSPPGDTVPGYRQFGDCEVPTVHVTGSPAASPSP